LLEQLEAMPEDCLSALIGAVLVVALAAVVAYVLVRYFRGSIRV